MDAVRIATAELCLNMSKTLDLLSALTEISKEKETFLAADNIEQLRAATDREEEFIAELGQAERDRDICTGALSKAIGFMGKDVKLGELIAGIKDIEIRRQLTSQRSVLTAAMNTLTAQNEKLNQLLALQINYTEYMINIMYVPKSRSNSYDIQGSRRDMTNQMSLYDLHA